MQEQPPLGPGGTPPPYPPTGQPYYGAPIVPAAPVNPNKEFPVQAAKFSLYAALFAFLINCATTQQRGAPTAWLLVVTVLCFLLIVSGFVLGLIALVKNRTRKLPGVRGYAIAGVAINGFFLLANILLFGNLLLRG